MHIRRQPVSLSRIRLHKTTDEAEQQDNTKSMDLVAVIGRHFRYRLQTTMLNKDGVLLSMRLCYKEIIFVWLGLPCWVQFYSRTSADKSYCSPIAMLVYTKSGIALCTCLQGDISPRTTVFPTLKVIVRWKSLIIKFLEAVGWNRQYLFIYYSLYLTSILSRHFFQWKEKLKNRLKCGLWGGGKKNQIKVK